MWHKVVVFKACLKPSLDEAYSTTASIKGKLANLQETQQKLQANNSRLANEKFVEEVKHTMS